MRNLLVAAALGTVTLTAATVATPAEAQRWGYHRPGGYYGNYHRDRWATRAYRNRYYYGRGYRHGWRGGYGRPRYYGGYHGGPRRHWR